jgi:hypothetical protein
VAAVVVQVLVVEQIVEALVVLVVLGLRLQSQVLR